MPMPKGVKPYATAWVECSEHEFKIALQSMRSNGMTLIQAALFNQTIYRDDAGHIIARQYQHKRNTQSLITIALREHIPTRKHINTTEGSIYAA